MVARAGKLKVEKKEILWSDRKRILGLPISFTRYSIDNERLYVKKGFFSTELDEILLYRILDIKSVRSLWQKLFGVGTLILYNADQTNPELKLKNIRKSEKLHRYMSDLIERNRVEKGIAGREIVGMASHGGLYGDGGHESPEIHECHCDHAEPIPFDEAPDAIEH